MLGDCKWLDFKLCTNPNRPEPFPKQRLCMKKVCKTYRAANNILVEAKPSAAEVGAVANEVEGVDEDSEVEEEEVGL